jgi:3D (Asp-Asp-Asp) domain-containing protein
VLTVLITSLILLIPTATKEVITVTKEVPKIVKVATIETVTTIVEKQIPVIRTVDVETRWYEFTATGYSANDPSQGTSDTMASGKKCYVGAVAADPDILPLGTEIEIEGLGKFVVEDTGGKILGRRIDIYFESKLDALAYGTRSIWVNIIKWGGTS